MIVTLFELDRMIKKKKKKKQTRRTLWTLLRGTINRWLGGSSATPRQHTMEYGVHVWRTAK